MPATQSGRITGGDGAPSEEWEFAGTRGDQLLLHIIPSQRAHLVLQATVYNAATEELVARRDGIAGRTELPLSLPTTGKYVIELHATGIQTPDSEGRALYTVELRRHPR